MKNLSYKKVLFVLLALLCAIPFVKPPLALLAGFLFTLFLGNPFPNLKGKMTSLLLKVSIVGLGFGIHVGEALQTGKQGFLLTFSTILLTLIAGYFIGKQLRLNRRSSYLISFGTAICGGSAIAAVAPIVKASEDEISTSLGVVFLLNSVALLIFPSIGHCLNLSQEQFGLWSAVAIHDTSSVVGAATTYGSDALQIATTVKLARTLWIIPLSLLSLLLFKPESKKVQIPWFIAAFIGAMLIHSYFPLPSMIEVGITKTAKSLLVVTLFLTGANLSITTLRRLGWKFLLLGVLLWLLISLFSLGFIMNQ